VNGYRSFIEQLAEKHHPWPKASISKSLAKLDDKGVTNGVVALLRQKYPSDWLDDAGVPKLGAAGGEKPATLADPIPVIRITKEIGHAAGRSDKLAAKMQRHNYLLEKRAGKWYCQRADAMAMFPNSKHKEKIKEI
jgi:hypothetical protein